MTLVEHAENSKQVDFQARSTSGESSCHIQECEFALLISRFQAPPLRGLSHIL
jgi:hypothetical protein